MTIEEAIDKKVKLEQEINKLVLKFIKETKLYIEDIDIDYCAGFVKINVEAKL